MKTEVIHLIDTNDRIITLCGESTECPEIHM